MLYLDFEKKLNTPAIIQSYSILFHTYIVVSDDDHDNQCFIVSRIFINFWIDFTDSVDTWHVPRWLLFQSNNLQSLLKKQKRKIITQFHN